VIGAYLLPDQPAGHRVGVPVGQPQGDLVGGGHPTTPGLLGGEPSDSHGSWTPGCLIRPRLSMARRVILSGIHEVCTGQPGCCSGRLRVIS
jgi:hypothetical protein